MLKDNSKMVKEKYLVSFCMYMMSDRVLAGENLGVIRSLLSSPVRAPWDFALCPFVFPVYFAFWKCVSSNRYLRQLPPKKQMNKSISVNT